MMRGSQTDDQGEGPAALPGLRVREARPAPQFVLFLARALTVLALTVALAMTAAAQDSQTTRSPTGRADAVPRQRRP